MFYLLLTHSSLSLHHRLSSNSHLFFWWNISFTLEIFFLLEHSLFITHVTDSQVNIWLYWMIDYKMLIHKIINTLLWRFSPDDFHICLSTVFSKVYLTHEKYWEYALRFLSDPHNFPSADRMNEHWTEYRYTGLTFSPSAFIY